MKQTKSVQEFIVGAAHYYVSSPDGSSAVLRIDYRGNTFTIERRSKRLSRLFRLEASEIAQDLLQRKHGVNYADPVSQ